jgi:hypothetical protein
VEDRLGQRPRGVGDDAERAGGETEATEVSLDHEYVVVSESPAQVCGARRVTLDRDDTRSRQQERGCQGAGAGAQVDDEVAWSYASVSDDRASSFGVECVPSPARRGTVGAHDAPSP